MDSKLKTVTDAFLVLRAYKHKLRLKILKYIAEKKRINVTELYHHFRIEQSVASQHLAILRKAGFVITEREGKFIWYSVDHNRINKVAELCDQINGTSSILLETEVKIPQGIVATKPTATSKKKVAVA